MVLLRRYLDQIIIVVLFAVACIPYWPFKIDDAYISFVYARNWVQGQGLTYNGLNVEGYSNFLWTVLIAAFLRLGLDPLLAARGLSLIFGAMCLLAIHKLHTRLNPGLGRGSALLATLSVGLSAPFLIWTVGGLETVFFASLITASVYTELAGGSYSRYGTPLLLLAVALTRPEGAMLFPIFLLYRWWRGQRTIASLFEPALLFLVPYSLYIFWRYSTYGYPLPNTAYLKLDPNLETTGLAIEWLFDYLRLRPIFAILLVAGLVRLGAQRRSSDSRWLLTSAVILAFVGFVLYSGRDWMPHHRFLVPIIPLFGLYIGQILADYKNKRFLLVFQALVVSSILFEILLSLTLYRPLSVDFGRYTDDLIQVGQWIGETGHPNETIAIEDAGAIAYYSQRPTVDILGLNDEHIAHSPEKSDPVYVLSQKPTIIQLNASYSSTGTLEGWIKLKAIREIVNHPDFRSCYRPDTNRPPGPYYPYLFFRRCP